MGAQVQYNSYLPGYYSMRDLNDDSNGGTWPLCYGDKSLINGQYYNAFLPRTIPDVYVGYDKNAVKQKMLEHEATFKNQVHELHRLYRIQRDLMEEIKRKELQKHHIPAESSLFSSSLASEQSGNWHVPHFPLANSTGTRLPVMGAEDSHSQFSFLKGKTPQIDLDPSQNVGSSKDCEVSECRPTKVRRKMFDLQLPADDYIDTAEVEQRGDKKVFNLSSYPSNSCHSAAPSYGVKEVPQNVGKTDCLGNTFRSCFRSRNGLADLNEPVQVEDTSSPASLDFLGHSRSLRDGQGQEIFTSNSQFLGLSKETLQSSHYVKEDKKSSDLHMRREDNERECISYMLDSRQSKSNMTSFSQGLPPEKISKPAQPFQAMLNKAQEPSSSFRNDQSKGEYWEEGTIDGLKVFSRSHDFPNHNLSESDMAPHLSNPYPFIPPSELPKSWSYSTSSWEKLNSSLSQKSMTVHTQPCFNSSVTLTKSSQSSTQGPGIYGEKRHIPSGFGSEVPRNNGFYQGSPSGSKELPAGFSSIGFDYLTCRNAGNVSSKYVSNDNQMKYCESLNCLDVNSSKDINLNVMLSHSSSNEAVPQPNLDTMDGGKKQDPLSVLPWFKPKPAFKDEATYARRDVDTRELSLSQVSSNQFSNKIDSGKSPTKSFAQVIASGSCACDGDSKGDDTRGCANTKKILGFPIFGKPHVSKDSSFPITLSASPLLHKDADSKSIEKVRGFDINLPCESASLDLDKESATEIHITERAIEVNIASFRKNFDLNSCITEDDASIATSVPSNNVQIARGIDLEAPVVPEIEEESLEEKESPEKHKKTIHISAQQEVKCLYDEYVTVAAEAIVTISSLELFNPLENSSCNSSDTSVGNLNWFVDVISSCANDLELKSGEVLGERDGQDKEKSSSDEMDYFESMTLKLTETNVEEYVSNLALQENPKMEEETGTTLMTNRPRKGQARRGRQRRDFQRDILPGLASLSRHEVTEDLQTFGGLMRATGHAWQMGITRRATTRNGSARGRRRLAARTTPDTDPTPVYTPPTHQLNGIEVGLEDRSLTGWGKTTRRPRRQRCPAGNPSSLPLS